MIVVVSDTSPLRALHHLRLLNVLDRLFEHVLVPPAVEAELIRALGRSAAASILAVAPVRLEAPRDSARVQSLRRTLDAGESEAIVLATETDAHAVLIDEAAGRAAARAVGLRPIGVLGVLLQAKQDGFLKELRPLMDELRSGLNFFISAPLREEVLRAAGEPLS